MSLGCGTAGPGAACRAQGNKPACLSTHLSTHLMVGPPQFFALDCEMTGLFLRDKSGAYLDEIHDRYQEVRRSGAARCSPTAPSGWRRSAACRCCPLLLVAPPLWRMLASTWGSKRAVVFQVMLFVCFQHELVLARVRRLPAAPAEQWCFPRSGLPSKRHTTSPPMRCRCWPAAAPL